MNINVGDYVRTTDGIIGKVVNVFNNIPPEPWELVLDNGVDLHEEDLSNRDIQIKAHSENLIDLIEVGDFVNGFLIDYLSLNYTIPFIRSERPYREDTGAYSKLKEKGKHYNQPLNFVNEDIETILTKEQYGRNCYRVEV